jgi:hypothetical protein
VMSLRRRIKNRKRKYSRITGKASENEEAMNEDRMARQQSCAGRAGEGRRGRGSKN